MTTANAGSSAGGVIRILVADDHAVVREGLCALLETQPDFRVAGTACNGEEALHKIRELKPDIVLLDLAMPLMSGAEVMRELKELRLGTRAILLTAAVARPDIVRLVQLGVRGVILKDSPTALIFKSIRRVHQGELWVDREMMGEIADALAAPSDGPASRTFKLTPREREVVRLVSEGETNRGMAKRMKVSEDTIKHHLTSIFNKTGVSNRLELALFALHHGLATRD